MSLTMSLCTRIIPNIEHRFSYACGIVPIESFLDYTILIQQMSCITTRFPWCYSGFGEDDDAFASWKNGLRILIMMFGLEQYSSIKPCLFSIKRWEKDFYMSQMGVKSRLLWKQGKMPTCGFMFSSKFSPSRSRIFWHGLFKSNFGCGCNTHYHNQQDK